MKYNRNGCYEYVRVAKAVVNEEKSNKDAYLNSLNQFVLKMKVKVKFLISQLVKSSYVFVLSRSA